MISPGASSSTPNRGFAIVTAITLLAIVSLCMVVLAAAFEHEIARTRHTRERLQLELLTSAGMISVTAYVAAIRPPVTAIFTRRWQLALPAALQRKGGTVKLQISKTTSGQMIATVFATYAGLHTRRIITFFPKGRRWRAESLALHGRLHTLGGPVSAAISGQSGIWLSGAGHPPFALMGVIHVHCRLVPIGSIKNLTGVLVFKQFHSQRCFTVTVLCHIPPAGINAPFTWPVPNGLWQGHYRVFLRFERNNEIVGRSNGFTTKILGKIFY